jgi:hypothetical protein
MVPATFVQPGPPHWEYSAKEGPELVAVNIGAKLDDLTLGIIVEMIGMDALNAEDALEMSRVTLRSRISMKQRLSSSHQRLSLKMTSSMLLS